MGKKKSVLRSILTSVRKTIINPVKTFFKKSISSIGEQIKIDRLTRERDNIVKANKKLSKTNVNLNLEKTQIVNDNTSIINDWSNINTGVQTSITNQNLLKDNNANDIAVHDNKIIEKKDKINFLKKNILYNTLFDTNTKKNIYYSIKNENSNINKNIDIYNVSMSKNGQKYKYTIQQLNEIEDINTVFFIIYYLLFIAFCYIVFYKNISKKIKLLLFFLFLLYPFFVYSLETLIYTIFNNIYLYIISIYNIEKIYE
jgi:hypothetical protein